MRGLLIENIMLKKPNPTKIPIILGMIIFVLVGCKQAEPTLSADTVLTSVALTVDASMALTLEPTATQDSTSTPTGTRTPSPSPTEVEIVFTPTASSTLPPAESCDSATYVSDVTIPDGTQMAPGTDFIKTWQILNTGSCTWSLEYRVAFSSGDIMDGATPQVLGVESVAPGNIVEISIEMTAPDSNGEYTGYWRMENADGTAFGDAFYVEIAVTDTEDPITPTHTNVPVDTETPTPTVEDTPTAEPPTATATSP